MTTLASLIRRLHVPLAEVDVLRETHAHRAPTAGWVVVALGACSLFAGCAFDASRADNASSESLSAPPAATASDPLSAPNLPNANGSTPATPLTKPASFRTSLSRRGFTRDPSMPPDDTKPGPHPWDPQTEGTSNTGAGTTPNSSK
ncbi:MAG: hypothetical protein NVS3B20_27660 [Polyangiales bacterium]